LSEPLKAFHSYAWFSVQVDQYYAALRIFGRHYDALKAAYGHLPTHGRHPELAALNEESRMFFISAASALGYMGTTRIFEDAPFPELKRLPEDMVNFGFYTCFCFQWTLFENFVKDSLLRLADVGMLPVAVSNELRTRQRRARGFLEYIDQGHVFGHSPFVAVRPVMGWLPITENCTFPDLDAIRELRNQFIHGVSGPDILPATEPEKERLYERSMWLLRQFAGNVDTEVRRVREAHGGAEP
jgi:hypothetical protein